MGDASREKVSAARVLMDGGTSAAPPEPSDAVINLELCVFAFCVL